MVQTVEAGQRAKPLREVIRDTVRNRIFEGQYTPGSRLVERDLAAEFNVSRLPVREALRMLQQEGLVTEPATRGSVVATLDADQVDDLFSVRIALEVLACRLAAERATPDDIARLTALVDRTKDALARGSLAETHALNSEFHDEVTRIADNDFLRTALEPLQGRMHWLFRHVRDLPELVEEHQLLLTAIASGDPDRAAAQSAHHIDKYREQYPDTV
ncbi:GntR family transcriptional regulator [Microbacterium sp. Au-Mic1]|uniref:GntR family transcriptional regulator n=1 Tax=Microbacterium sp. Au-Mic1 TaxID=2906457 RepID=UPI001E5F9077|nr:GntR family transcriptional regulator [Microbacterium sp. Au-Mic1]MCE4026999.1 GntR family transcriptional regulator [Microbacterium sp. Au-Mic1]